jgi:UDP-N-acetylmuramoyl-tripeptide--D-alanyl-D-alanine ligase
MKIEELYKIYLKTPFITTDSRDIQKSSLFFALRGNKFNGNSFAESALQNGAAFAVIDDKDYLVNDKCILVENVLKTLQSLASYRRKKLGVPVIAVTGTNGKTTTKELLYAVLSKKYKVTVTKGNLNNHIGVPLTLLTMNNETEFCIIEMGANHIGEITQLCLISDPDYGIVTNIGKAHLEGFGSLEGVIKAKSELYYFLKEKKGHILYNLDNPILSKIVRQVKTESISYGTGKKAFCQGMKLSADPYLKLQIKNYPSINGLKDIDINTNLTGDYNFENVMAAICTGIYMKVNIKLIAEAINEYHPLNNRSQLLNTTKNKVIIDCYNANPTSMEAAIFSFSKLDPKGYTKVLILGDMFELGKYSIIEHKKIINIIKKLAFGKVYLVGQDFQKTNTNKYFMTFITPDELIQFFSKNPLTHAYILLKGSRGIKMEKLLDIL